MYLNHESVYIECLPKLVYPSWSLILQVLPKLREEQWCQIQYLEMTQEFFVFFRFLARTEWMLQSCSNQRIRKSEGCRLIHFPGFLQRMGRATKLQGEMTFPPKDEKFNLALFGSFQSNFKIKIESKDREMCDLQRETTAKKCLPNTRYSSEHLCLNSQNSPYKPRKQEVASSQMRKLRSREAKQLLQNGIANQQRDRELNSSRPMSAPQLYYAFCQRIQL